MEEKAREITLLRKPQRFRIIKWMMVIYLGNTSLKCNLLNTEDMLVNGIILIILLRNSIIRRMRYITFIVTETLVTIVFY